MIAKSEELVQKLLEKKFISYEQFGEIKKYNALGIFSLNYELRFFLYLAVLFFTSGVGVLIYENIDSIGHNAIITALFVLTGLCFYFCFKKAKGFRKEEVLFENPVFDYLVLLSTILSCILIGYVQYQYDLFGYDWSTLIGCVIGFLCAYYFDNKSALSIGITGLATFIGITVTPKALLGSEMYSNPTLSYYGFSLGVLLIVWCEYAIRNNIKKHFNLVFLTFALHLIGISCIAGMTEDYWFIFVFLQAVLMYYFYNISYKIDAISIFVFTLIYSFISFNILLYRISEFIDLSYLTSLIILGTPVYFIGSILLFIKLIKQFKKSKNDSHQ
jgi:hypothetical protein